MDPSGGSQPATAYGIISSIMTTIRAFIAIDLPVEARTALTDFQNRLKAIVPPNTVRWTGPQNIHLTLHFLGNIAANEVVKVIEVLESRSAAYPPFSLTLAGLGCFPNLRRPRIVWVGVEGDTASLVGLHHDVGQQLKVIDFRPEARPYSPHLTLGRVNKGIPARRLQQLGEAIEREQPGTGPLARLTVTEINLMQSELKPGGPVYTRLGRGLLTG